LISSKARFLDSSCLLTCPKVNDILTSSSEQHTRHAFERLGPEMIATRRMDLLIAKYTTLLRFAPRAVRTPISFVRGIRGDAVATTEARGVRH